MTNGPPAGDGATPTFADLVATSRAVAATSGRLDKVTALADLLRRVPPDQVPIAIGLLVGEPRQGRLGVGWARCPGPKCPRRRRRH